MIIRIWALWTLDNFEYICTIVHMRIVTEVIIKRRNGETFSLVYKNIGNSPFDVPGIKTKATTNDIIEAIRESRSKV